MALLGKMTVEDLKALGLDPADIQAIKAGQLSEARIKELISESVGTTIADQVKNGFAELEKKLVAKPVENKPNDPPNDDSGDKLAEFMADPIAAVRKQVIEGTQDVRAHSMQMAADLAYDNARRSLPHFSIPAVADEIKAEWDKYPIQVKGNPQVLIKNIYDMVIGRHLDEIRMDSDKKDGKYNIFQSGGSTRVNGDLTPSKKPEDSLTQKELAAAKAFGISPEEYAKTKGDMSYVS